MVAGAVSDSLLWGRRCVLELGGVSGLDRLVVTSDREPVVSALLGGRQIAVDDVAVRRLGRINRPK